MSSANLIVKRLRHASNFITEFGSFDSHQIIGLLSSAANFIEEQDFWLSYACGEKIDIVKKPPTKIEPNKYSIAVKDYDEINETPNNETLYVDAYSSDEDMKKEMEYHNRQFCGGI